ncbi:MAG: hypothetical protein IJY50_07730, partial [Clostridia bacterium]|nr:hypothetical protein [Clostridia bacterium]
IMHTVVYCPGEGQGSGDIESIEQGTELTLKTFDEAGLVAPEGKVFDKWSIRHGSVLGAELAAKQAGEKITVSATTYVLAIWKDAPAEHIHAHGSEWKTDADNHWNECECTAKANVGAHADADADGKCDVCAYQMSTPDNSGEGTQNGGNASTETEAPTTDSPADTSEQNSGCGSTVTLSALATVGIIGMAFAFKKKED